MPVPCSTNSVRAWPGTSAWKKRSCSQRCSLPTARPGRPKGGSDGAYQEFKLVSFYDPDKSHQYAVGTRGDHAALGRLMRREGSKVRIDEARHKYSVTDGAEWIPKEYDVQLPMLEENAP